MSQLDALNEMPLYPTDDIIWDENVVPTEYFSGEGCLALPKLNLQFLTLHDYLLRNFNLFRLESTCMYIYCSIYCKSVDCGNNFLVKYFVIKSLFFTIFLCRMNVLNFVKIFR